MPIYEYECLSCGRRHEIVQKYTDMPATECPACGGPLRKLISSTSFVLKGTGWYKTDYASSGTGKAKESKKGNGAAPQAGSDTKKVTTGTEPAKKPDSASKPE
jgi:putative FmdB family regulatory protein